MKNQRQAVNAETDRICYIPMYIIYSSVSMPIVCNDFDMALEKARYISKFIGIDIEARIFDTLLGKYTTTYINGKIIK